MAEQNILNITLKEYRKQINDLRSELLNLQKGSAEYAKVADDIRQRQSKLNEVMSVGKGNADALEGSYNALVNQMSELRKQWKATNDEAERDAIGKQILSINNQLKGMDASIGNYQRNVGDYANAFVSAFDQMGVSLGGAAKGFTLATSASSGFKTALDLLKAHPIIAVITLLVAIFLKLKSAISENATLSAKWSKALATFKPIINAIINVIDWLAGILVDLFSLIAENIPKVVKMIGSGAKTITNILGNIVDIILFIPSKVIEAFAWLGQKISAFLNAVMHTVAKVADAIGLDKLANGIRSVGDSIDSFVKSASNGITNLVKNAGNYVKQVGTSIDKWANSLSNSMIKARKAESDRQKLAKQTREDEIKTAESEKRRADLRLKAANSEGKERLKYQKMLSKEIEINGKRQVALAKEQYRQAEYFASLTPTDAEGKKRLAELKANTVRVEAQYKQTMVKVATQMRETRNQIASGAKATTATLKTENAKRVADTKKSLDTTGENVKKFLSKLSEDMKTEDSFTKRMLDDSNQQAELLKSIGKYTIDEQFNTEKERTKIVKEGIKNREALLDKAMQYLIDNGRQETEEYKKLEVDKMNLNYEYLRESAQNQINTNKIKLENEKETYEKIVKAREDMFSRGSVENTMKQSEEYVDITDKYLDGLITYETYQQELADMDGRYKQLEVDRQIEADELKLQELIDYYESVKAITGENSSELTALQEQITQQQINLEQQKSDRLRKIAESEVKNKQKNDKAEEKLMKLKEKRQQNNLNTYSKFSSAMQSIMGENSKATKALALTDAVVSTWVGANKILKEGPSAYGPGPIGVALMYASMAGEIATGMANVKNIMSEKSEGASSAVNETVSTLSSAQVTPLLDESRDQLALATYDVNGGNQRVYVVESDISSTQKKVQVMENESTF